MDAQDDDDEWTLPPEDYVALDSLPSPAPACVRAVTNAGHCVIIDSGADISCIPETFQLCGRARPLQVQDAQGGAMQVQAERLVDFVLHGGQQPVVIRERCVVANVTQPLLSLGRLMRKGWWPVRRGQGDNAGLGAMCLSHPRSGAQAPLMFKGYSLGVNAQIRRVENETCDLIYHNPGEGGANDRSEEDVSEGELHAGLAKPSQQQGRDANSQQQVRDAHSQQVRDADSQQVRDADSQQVRDADSQQVRDADSQQVRDADSQQVHGVRYDQVQYHATGEVREVCATGEVRVSTGALQVASIQVRLEAKALDAIEYGWQVGATGHLVWQGRTSRFVDPSMMAPISHKLAVSLDFVAAQWHLVSA